MSDKEYLQYLKDQEMKQYKNASDKTSQNKSISCLTRLLSFMVLIAIIMSGLVMGLWYFRLLPTPIDQTISRIISTPTREPLATIMPTAGIISTSPPPSTLTPACLVPDLVGLDQIAAESSIINLGLQVVKTNEYNANIGFGLIISQEPAPQSRLEPCRGEVILVISLGIQPNPATIVPTLTQIPTIPASTQTLTIPAPTATATPNLPVLPTATPDVRLFWDDFETGIRPEWDMTGQNFNSADGKLVSAGTLRANIGDVTWANYRIVFDDWSWSSGTTIRIRVQDDKNYMSLVTYSNRACDWYKVSNGDALRVPDLNCRLPRSLAIDIQGNEYRIVNLQDETVQTRFVDDTVRYGGISIESFQRDSLSLGAIEVYPLP